LIGSFKSFLVEEEKTVYFTWGRMNPPTIGHEKLLDVLSRKAGNNPYFIYLTQSTDNKKNPVDYKQKVKIARKMFPKHARKIMIDNKIKSIFDLLVKLHNSGYKNISMVVGSDRVNEFGILLKKYNGKKGRHGLYNFRSINVISAGDRDPDAEGASGMSASKMRDAAKAGDFAKFGQGLPRNYSNADAKQLFNAVRKGMGLKEQSDYKKHVQLNSVSETREAYVNGDLFSVDDKVIIKESNIVGKVTHLGSNYVIVESTEGERRYWLDAIEAVDHVDVAKKRIEREKEADGKRHDRMMDRARTRNTNVKNKETTEKTTSPQDPDIKDRKGTQPKAYHSGIKSKATKAARDAHFKKGAKMDDDNPAAYKKAPGDAKAKTKPSKHTLKFKQMFGDD
tara:strand:+ start:4977 stop:6158 length:1182 start_codon:yes stop_codon:yes gene_type:complete